MEIILYDASQKSVPLSETVLPLPPKEETFSFSFSQPQKLSLNKILGNLFFTLALAGLFYIFLPVVIAKIQNSQTPQISQPVSQTTFATLFEEEEKQILQQDLQEAEKYQVDPSFSLVIPKISAKAKIIPNVDPANEELYSKSLKEGVAHAKGTNFPGSKGTIYLFAHSTNTLENVSRYNAIFFRLKELEPGDKVIIFFGGKKYTYQVVDQKITEANDTFWLAPQNFSNEEILILQTCWPPGTSLKRLLVTAIRV